VSQRQQTYSSYGTYDPHALTRYDDRGVYKKECE
jgi:hypothetical protein